MAHSEGLPWWRVVRASGLPPADHAAEALPHYEREGTPLRWAADRSSYRLNMTRAAWFPEP